MVAKGPPDLVPSAHSLIIAQRNQQQSRLLRLPAELRIRIYEFTMDLDTDKIFHDDHYDWDRLDFARTSHQVFAETAQSYFESKLLPLCSDKGVSFKDPEQWAQLVDKLTLAQTTQITLLVLPIQTVYATVNAKTWSKYWIQPHLPTLGVFRHTFQQEASDREVKRSILAFLRLDRATPIQLVDDQHGTVEIS